MNEFIASKLRPWQLEPVRHLLEILGSHDSALDSSETGTGKTFTACAVAKVLALPTAVVCPKISMSLWRRTAAHFEDTISVLNYESIRTGKSPFGAFTNQKSVNARRRVTHVCEYCQRRFGEGNIDLFCPANAQGIHCIINKPKRIIRGIFQWNQAIKFLILDEVHRCGGMNSLNAELLIAAKRQGIKHLMLSATPAQTILQMRAIGYSLDLFSL